MADKRSTASGDSTDSVASGSPAGKSGRNLRSLTLTALLGIFILAVFLAVVRHFLPGRLTVALRRAIGRRAGRE